MSFDPIFTGIFNDENNIDIVENFLSVYLKVPIEKIKGHVKINSRKLISKARLEHQKEVDLILDLDKDKINIELNNKYSKNFVERNIVFASKIHGGQLKRGDKTYSKISKTLQINLNNYRCNEDSLIETYYFQNEKGKKLSEKLRIDLVDIVKAKKLEYNEENEKLARWLRIISSLSIEDLIKELGDDLMEKETKEKLIEEVKRYNEDEEIIELYSDYSKYELERNTLIEEAKEEATKEGMQQGIEQGIQQGRKEGVEQNKIEIANKMLEKHMAIEYISEITGLSLEEINKMSA